MTDRRPSELAIRSSSKLLASSSLHRQGVGAAYLYLLEAGVIYVVDEAIARDLVVQHHSIEIVDADAGVLPIVLPPTDARQAREWLHGKRSRSRAERIRDLRERYPIPLDSVADVALRLIDELRWSEDDAVAKVTAMYDRAVTERRAYREGWIAEADELIAGEREGASA